MLFVCTVFAGLLLLLLVIIMWGLAKISSVNRTVEDEEQELFCQEKLRRIKSKPIM